MILPMNQSLMLHIAKRRIVIDGRSRNRNHRMGLQSQIHPNLKITQKRLTVTLTDAIPIAIDKGTLANRFPRV
jgi:hypothetical protein